MAGVRSFSTVRARSYVSRLPLFTRAIILIMIVLWIAGVQSVWNIRSWGALIPDKVTLATGKLLFPLHGRVMGIAHFGGQSDECAGYRLSTFPLIHLNFFHAALNIFALTPLMERFENEFGTLTTLTLFFGRKCRIIAL
jgi:membrane associated rhomboid family serine protease